MTQAADEFVERIKAMSDEQLLTAYKNYHAKYDALEDERQACWKRMMTIRNEQESMFDEITALNVAVHGVRKLTVPREPAK